MDNLPSDVRTLIERARRHDGPTARDKERVDQKLNLALAAAGGAASLLVSKSAVAFTTVAVGEAASAATSASVATSSGASAVSVMSATSTTTSVAGAAGASAVGAAGSASVMGAIAGKVVAGPATALATKWGGGTVVAWLVGAGVVGAGAISAPNVVDWVQSEAAVTAATALEQATTYVRPPAPPGAHPNPGVRSAGASVPTVALVTSAPEPAAADVAQLSNSGVAPKAVTPVAPSNDRLEIRGANDAVAEVALLSQAQRASAEGDANRALALLLEHGKRFPKSALSTERSAARVFAFCQLGRVDEARAAALVFFKNGAGSPLMPKVQASCIKDESKD